MGTVHSESAEAVLGGPDSVPLPACPGEPNPAPFSMAFITDISVLGIKQRGRKV